MRFSGTKTSVDAALVAALVYIASCAKLAPPQPPDNIADTTSHAFTWQKTYLGDVGATSRLNDVAIINDTLAFAVGQVYLKDSTGQIDPNAYSIAVWNGSSWELKRLFYTGNNLILSVRGVFPLGANDVWLAAGSVFHWDGVTNQAELRFSRLSLPGPNATVEKVWTSFRGNLYGVGNVGTIVYYDGIVWQKLSSGTTLDIKDVFGANNPESGASEIVAVAGNPYSGLERAVLGLSGTSISALATSGINDALAGTWFVPGNRYYAVGGRIYEKSNLNDSVWTKEPTTLTNNFTRAIRGAASNDVFIVGDFGEVLHFNGYSWKSYLPQTGISTGAYYSLAVKDNLVVAVGEDAPRAIILIGRRVR